MHRTPPDTAKRHKGKQPALGTSSTSRTPLTGSDTEPEDQQHEFESPLGEFVDQTPRASRPAHQTSIMADQALQEENRRLQEQLAQTAAVFARRSESVDPEQEERARQHEIRLKRLEYKANERTKERAMQHKLEMAKLQL